MEKFYSVTELADAYGITARAIRFYESKGLLTPQRVGWTRAYTHRERARLELILRGKRLGFSLADIKEYLALYDADPKQVEQLAWLTEKIRARIVELEEQRDTLSNALSELKDIERQAEAALRERGTGPSAANRHGANRPAGVDQDTPRQPKRSPG
ncbi:MAG: MerR family DNA-binding transcriptional regulator [Acidiferrobacterales bacterium]